MQIFDASSMIYAWDNYPILQFPGLWEWMAIQVDEKKLLIPSVAVEEINKKTPDCGEWLRQNNLEQLAITNAILHDAIHIKGLLGIVDDKYHAKGVGENDLLIIATAKHHQAELVSNEEDQLNLPQIAAKRKIPAVCKMVQVSVSCKSYIEFIKGSNEIFR